MESAPRIRAISRPSLSVLSRQSIVDPEKSGRCQSISEHEFQSSYTYTPPRLSAAMLASLTLKALGIIYGDIGTSPLYVISAIFADLGTDTVLPEDVVGAISLVVWTIMLMVIVKYLIFTLQADNHGEGGITSLLGLVRESVSGWHREMLILLGILGTSFIIADSAFTPAVSVLSAIEGIETYRPELSDCTVLITELILIALFLVQFLGTSKIGFMFGPIMILWFLALALIGGNQIAQAPSILKAFNPVEGIQFLVRYGQTGFFTLGAVFLCVTGVEALYADLGHFTANPIRIGFLCLVFPGLVLNYLGQGALLISDPTAISNPFYLAVPTPLFWPMLVLSTLATIIASQAMITGCFSLVSTAISMQLCPYLPIYYTSDELQGQIYMPHVNYILMIATVSIVAGFGSASAITNAYGLSITVVLVITTTLFSVLTLHVWKWRWYLISPVLLIFLAMDGTFLAASISKFVTGGWVTVMLGLIITVLLKTWERGRREVDKLSERDALASRFLLPSTNPNVPHNYDVVRTPGMVVFFSGSSHQAPSTFVQYVQRTRSIPSLTVLLTIRFELVPFINPEDRVHCVETQEKVFHVTASYGFAEQKAVNVHKILEMLQNELPKQRRHHPIFVIGRDVIDTKKGDPLFMRLYLPLYHFLVRNTDSIVRTFKIEERYILELINHLQLSETSNSASNATMLSSKSFIDSHELEDKLLKLDAKASSSNTNANINALEPLKLDEDPLSTLV